MEDKLEEFVALLRKQGPRPIEPRNRPRPPVPAAARLLKPKAWSWADFAWPTRERLFWNLGGAAVAVAVFALGFWLALPSAPKPVHVAALPAPAPAASAKVTVAIPEPVASAEPERNEAIRPDEGEPPVPAPPDVADASAAAEPPPAPPAAKPAAPLQAIPAPDETKLASLPPPAPPSARQGEPAWLRFAVKPPAINGRPEIAIVLDDVGVDHKGAVRAITLPGPLTLSFMAYANDLATLTAAAHRAGDELIVHVPMEPLSRSEDMGPNGLAVGLSHDEILRRLRWDLSRFDGYVGINNHMGSRFTADAQGMTWVLEELKARGLLFLDSRTIGNSVGVAVARKLGVPHAARDVFLDDVLEPGPIAHQLAEVEAIARHHGKAIAIGHPHGVTLDVLEPWLKTLAAKGFVLVPLSTIVRQQTQVAGGTG